MMATPLGGRDLHDVEVVGGRPRWRKWLVRRKVLRVFLGAAVLLVYLVIALLHGGSLSSRPDPSGFHGATAEALLKGDFAVAPAPLELLALSDPYDPEQNSAVRNQGFHDYALHGSSLYTPFGPAPAVVLHIPYKVIGLGYLNPNLATLICIAAGFLAMCGATRLAIDRWAPGARWWVEPALLIGLGLGTSLPWLVSIGRAYEESIACGFMAVAVCLWALGRASVGIGRAWAWCLVASIGVGIAAGSRPHLAVSGILLLVAAVVVVRTRGADRRWLGFLAALLVPAGVAAAALLFYNAHRFGSPFEFGLSLQLAGQNMHTYRIGALSYVPPNLGDYLLSGPRFGSGSPYVFLLRSTFANDPSKHSHEPVAGMFTLFPWILVGLASGAASAVAWWRFQRDLLATALAVGFVATFSVLAVSSTFNASTMRYSVDFIPWFAVVACLGLLWVAVRAHMARPWRIAFTAVWSAALLWSVYAGMAIATIDCRGTGSC